MKEIKYYLIDNNSNLVEISKDDEMIKNYSSFGIELGIAHGIEVQQLLKVEILPIDLKVAPIKELPDYYAKRRLQLQQEEREQWEESRLWAERTIAENKEKKRQHQQVLIRVNKKSQGYFEEYDRKNDPRNRVDLSKGIFNKRKRSKRPPPQD